MGQRYKTEWNERQPYGLPAADDLVGRVLARRATGNLTREALADPAPGHLDDPWQLPDADKAVDRVVEAILLGERIAVESDFDADGLSASSVVWNALIDYFGVPEQQVGRFVGNRLTEGYGLSNPLVDRIIKWDADLVITMDNGSTDDERIQRLAGQGVDVIVTDHHEVSGAGPKHAYACVNPSRVDGHTYPDRAIAGCGVAFLLMWMVRTTLLRHGLIPSDTKSLADLLDYVAVGTTCDAVSLGASPNNRFFVSHGLSLINQRKRVCWDVTLELLGLERANAETLAFQIGPRINAKTRLSDPYAVMQYLTTASVAEARFGFEVLTEANEKRKVIEADMRDRAFDAIDGGNLAARDRHSIVHFDPNGHPGVHGICASRIVDRYGRAAVFLSPKHDGSGAITGSCRGVPDYNIHSILWDVNEHHPDMLTAWGGHSGAGGLTLADGVDTEAFGKAFEQSAARIAAEAGRNEPPAPVIWHDGRAQVDDLSLGTLNAFEALDPWGRGFEAPAFVVSGRVADAAAVGMDKSHVRLALVDELSGRVLPCIWFRALLDGAELNDVLTEGDAVEMIGKPTINRFRGRESVQLVVEDLRRN